MKMIHLGIGCTTALWLFLGSHALINSPNALPIALANSSPVELAFQPVMPTVSLSQLPPQARQTIILIQRGGPFPHRKDGTFFGNREKRLPLAPSGYYREYTVPTPGSRDRGARRIVTGQPQEYYYTQDHYRSFSKVKL
jgi:guanyl-specific ribonuclease Sa